MSDVDRLSNVTKAQFGDDSSIWIKPGEYDSIALALLDSIYSTGNRYTTVLRFIDKYKSIRAENTVDPDADSLVDLLSAFDGWGGVDGFVGKTGYRLRTYAHLNAPFKAEAVYQAALMLGGIGIKTRSDLEALSDRDSEIFAKVNKAWKKLPSQGSGITFHYFLMLQGMPGVKADRMVIRYVSDALEREVSAQDSADLVAKVAASWKVSASHLDHVIWRAASGRPWRLGESQ